MRKFTGKNDHGRLKWGDRNTKWSHKRASFRKQKNHIQGIQDNFGVWHEKGEKVEQVFVNYFANIFATSAPDVFDIHDDVQCILHCVSREMNEHLMVHFSEDEIRIALSHMFPTKVPGPNGFHALFYQKYWSIIKGKTVRCCLDILNEKGSVRKLNHTNIVLIPKKKSHNLPSDYRPISLCNVSYDLISKVLTNKLKPILQQIISKAQSAFVPDSLISDNILVSYECVEHIIGKKMGIAGKMTMKLDMSKAYDRMEWCFLESVMVKMGFSPSWIALIMDCIFSVSFSVLINDQP